MKLLLDTHALLWLAEGSAQLSAPARQAIRQADECLVSIASLWEMAIKCAIDKLRLEPSYEEWVRERLPRELRILPVRPEHLVDYVRLPLHHRDPFDRLFVAQARCEKLTLLSADPAMRAYDVPVIW